MNDLETIETVDRNGNVFTFDVLEEPLNVNEFTGVYYKIIVHDSPLWKHFVFQILFVDDSKILIFMIDNQGIGCLSSKGIVKAMINKIQLKYQLTIISSTNNSAFKYCESEGRISIVTHFWRKWSAENGKVIYIENEDRFFIYL